MATKKIKWFRGDGTLYHPETEFSMVTGTLAKTQRADVLEVASLGSTSVTTYTVFASQTISAQGNTNSSYLVVGGGNFGGTYNGMWLVECSGRGSVATMRVTELAHNASGTVGFGHYVSSGKAYFGITRSSYGAGIDIYHLNGALGELKLFQNNTTMPTGWTAVTPSVFARKGDIPDTSKFVTLDTDQEITAKKTFSGQVYFTGTTGIVIGSLEDGLQVTHHGFARSIGNATYPFPLPEGKSGTIALTSDIKTYTASTGISISSANAISTTAASASASGHVNTGAQTFAGRKTFNGGINITGGATIQLAGSSGTAGYVLTSNGTSSPTWKMMPTFTVSGNTLNIKTK